MVIVIIMIIILSPQPSSFFHALAFVSSFTCSIKNGKLRMQFLRGRSVNLLHVVWRL